MSSTDILSRLFPAYDGGHFTLPDEVLTARAAYDRLDALPMPETADYWAVREGLIAATVDAALSGAEELPECTGIDVARRAAQLNDDTHEVRRETLEALKARILGAVDATEVLVKHLAPAHDETVDALRNAWALVDGHLGKGGNRYSMPTKVAAAAESVDGLIVRYEAIHFARADLTIRLNYQPELDVDGQFSVISNPEQLWSRPQHNNITSSKPPWSGLDTAGVLRYMFANGGKVWLPEPSQQDARFAEVYAVELAQAAEQRERERVHATNSAAGDCEHRQVHAGSSATPRGTPAPRQAGQEGRAESATVTGCPRAARHGTHGHSRHHTGRPAPPPCCTSGAGTPGCHHSATPAGSGRCTPPHRTGQHGQAQHPLAAHPHLRPSTLPTSPSAGKTGRVGGANHNGNRGNATRQYSSRTDVGMRATQHRAPPARAVPCPPRCTTSTSTMATHHGCLSRRTPDGVTGMVQGDGQPGWSRPTVSDGGVRPTASGNGVGYHHNDHLGKDRSLGPSQFRVPETQEIIVIPPEGLCPMKNPRRPTGLKGPGTAFWRSIVDSFDLESHENALLIEACRTVDALAELDAAIQRDGAVLGTEDAPRVHPAVIESRLQRVALARLLDALKLPRDDDDKRPQGRRERNLHLAGGPAS